MEATKHGACNKTKEVSNWSSLVKLFFSPQGLEFCLGKCYPSYAQFREISRYVAPFNVYVDNPATEVSNPVNAAFIGDTLANVTVDSQDVVHKVVAMYGAKVRVYASNFSVVRIYCDEASDVQVVNDGTAVILK